jgi:hypothetical protein
MAESSTPKGKKDKNKKILIGLGIAVVGIAIWLLMRKKKPTSNIFLNITNYSASNYAPLSEAQVKSELEKANALVESKGVDGAITDLQSQVANLEAQGTPESLALAKLLKDFIADLQLQKENQTKSLTGSASSGSMIDSMGGSQPMAVTADVNDPRFTPLTPDQVQSEVDSTNASLVADGLPNTIKSINETITALSGSTNPQDIAKVKLLQYLLEQLTSQSPSAVTIDTANNSYAPLTPTQIKAEVDSTNASLSTNGVQSTLDTLNSRINQLSGSTNPSDIAMSRLLQNLASQLSGLASSSGTPYGSTSSSMGLPIGMTMGGTSMSGASSGMTTMGTSYGSTSMSMGLPTTMTPSTMLNIPPPAPAVPSLSNPIIHTCGTYTNWTIAWTNPLTRQPDPLDRTGEELSLAVAKFGGGNGIRVDVLPTNGLPTIVPFMLVKVTITVINKSNTASKVGFDLGFTNPSYTASNMVSYPFVKSIRMFNISKEEIGTTGAVFTFSGVVPSQGGNRFFIQPDNSLLPFGDWQSYEFKVKVQTGGCVSGAVVNTPLNISAGTMVGSGSVNDLLAPTRPTTTTTTTTPTTTSPTTMLSSMVNTMVSTIASACKYFSDAAYLTGSGLALGANVGNAFTIVLNNTSQGRYGTFRVVDSNGNFPIAGQTYRLKMESDIDIIGSANTGAFNFGSGTFTTFNYTSITPTTPIEADIVWGTPRADGFNGFTFKLPSWGLGTKTGNIRITISTLECVVPQPTTTTTRPVSTTSPITTTTTTTSPISTTTTTRV